MNTSQLVEKNFSILHPDMTLGQLANVIAHSKRNVFPVLVDPNKLVGILTLDDVRRDMFKTHLQEEKKVEDYMHYPPAIVELSEPMESVMKKFEDVESWNLPVVDEEQYIGFVSKSSIFNQYRDLLMKSSEEV
jgi:CIC family chloride channel protein